MFTGDLTASCYEVTPHCYYYSNVLIAMIRCLKPRVSAFIESGVIMVAEVVGHNALADTMLTMQCCQVKQSEE